jgi:hypothetical protein
MVRALQPALPTALFIIAGLLQAAAIACFLAGRQPTSVESSQRRARPRWPGVT